VSTIHLLVPNDFARQRPRRALRASGNVQESKPALALQDALARVIEHLQSMPQALLGRDEVRREMSDAKFQLKIF
jgi:hypothetical protein